MAFTRFLLQRLRPSTPKLLLFLFLSTLAVALEGVSLSLLIPLIQNGALPLGLSEVFSNEHSSFLANALVVLALLLALRQLVSFFQNLTEIRLSTQCLATFRSELLSRIYRDSSPALNGPAPGRLVHMYSIQTQSATELIFGVLKLLFSTTLVAAYLIGLCYLNWQLTILALVTGVFALFITFRMNQKARAVAILRTQKEEILEQHFLDDISGIKLIRAHQLEHSRLHTHNKKQEEWMALQNKNAHMRLAIHPLTFGAFAFTILLALAFLESIHPRVLYANAGTLALFILVLSRLHSRLGAIGYSMTSLAEDYCEAKGFFDFIRQQAVSPTSPFSTRTRERGEVDFETLTFAYPNGKTVFTNTNLKIETHKLTVISGPSGCGKTTLCQLIAGVHSPNTKPSFTPRVGVVFDDTFVFQESLLWNLSGGKQLPFREIEKAAQLAHIHEDIIALKDGYHTTFALRGFSFSKGQLKRFALARALLLKPELLVLDEPLSNLDEHTRRQLLGTLKSLSASTSILLFSHCREAIKAADVHMEIRDGLILNVRTIGPLPNHSRQPRKSPPIVSSHGERAAL